MKSKIKDPIQITVWDGRTMTLPKNNLMEIPFFKNYWLKNPEKTEFQLLYHYSEFKYFLKHLKDQLNYWCDNSWLEPIFNFFYSSEEILLSVSGWFYKISEKDLRKATYFESFLERWADLEESTDEYDLFIDEEPESFLDLLLFLKDPNYQVGEENLELLRYYSAPEPKRTIRDPHSDLNLKNDFDLPLPDGPNDLLINSIPLTMTISGQKFNQASNNIQSDLIAQIYSSVNDNQSQVIKFNLGSSRTHQISLLIRYEVLPENFGIASLYDLIENYKLVLEGNIIHSIPGHLLRCLEEAFYPESYQQILKDVQKDKLSYIIPLRAGILTCLEENPKINYFFQRMDLIITKNTKYNFYKPKTQLYVHQTAHPTDEINQDYYGTQISHQIININEKKSSELLFNLASSGLIVYRRSLQDLSYLPILELTFEVNGGLMSQKIDQNINAINKRTLGFNDLNPHIFIIPFEKNLKEVYYHPSQFKETRGGVNFSRIDHSKLKYQLPDDGQDSEIVVLNLCYNLYANIHNILGLRFCP